MRTTQSARYARWAGAIAILVAVAVGGVYLRRVFREAEARRTAPPPVAPSVQQQSHEFSFSKVEGDRTLYTIRASRATEFKDQGKNLLEDVWVTIYGREGARYDNLHTRQCDYQPANGRVVCEGDVQMDLESAEEAREKPGERVVHVNTKNVTFDRDTGVATTDQPAEFHFPNGEAHGVGVIYDTHAAHIILQHEAELTLKKDPNAGAPAVFTGSSMEYRRDLHRAQLFAPVHAVQGVRELTAELLTLEFDDQLRAHRAIATGNPVLHGAETSGPVDIAADKFVVEFNAAGWTERMIGEGNIHVVRTGKTEKDNFQAQHAVMELTPPSTGGNNPRELNANGGVKLAAQQGDESRRLETESLHLNFALGANPSQRHLESGETLGPGTIVTQAPGEDTEIHAKRFTFKFDEEGRLSRLLGHSGVEIHRQLGSGEPQTSTAEELAMDFSAGEWATLDETGNVRFREGEKTAQAGHAHMVRATDEVKLEQSPSVSDGQSSTTAQTIEMNQKTGDMRAAGRVRSSYLSADQGGPTNFGPEPAHVTADSVTGNSTDGHAVYTGHARMWQGASVIDADVIELWRKDQQLEARGHVLAVMEQAPDQSKEPSQEGGKEGGKPKTRAGANTSTKAGATTSSKASASATSNPSPNVTATPTLWHIRAPKMHYWSQDGRAVLEDNVSAESETGNLYSKRLELFLTSATSDGKGPRQLSRAVATGHVGVRLGDRHGSSERGEYTAAEGKFVLSEGLPMLTDASHDTTTGRQLTFFTANDTILVDSSAGTRTVTKHRVEK